MGESKIEKINSYFKGEWNQTAGFQVTRPPCDSGRLVICTEAEPVVTRNCASQRPGAGKAERQRALGKHRPQTASR